ncbi:MFS transporter [Streptomyces sp. NPDC097619]|uniref:MFS transporter n=1 Tax=Streptomyces sp. NPDC097619 TaxID=3157228 RepID=UPI00331E983A
MCLGWFLVMVDTTVVTVALPAIGAGLGGGTGLLQWVVDAYALAFAGLLLTGGALADRFGARPVYLGGTVVFAVGSVGCALAGTGAALVAARALQGVGAAALMPSSLSLIRAAYPDARRQARAVGIWGGLGGVAAALGPLLGGALLTAVSWLALFWLNLPLALVTLFLARRFREERGGAVPGDGARGEGPGPGRGRAPGGRRGGGFDVWGQGVAFAALVLSVAGVIRLGHAGGGGELASGAALTVAGVALGIAFPYVERRQPSPVVPPGLFRRSCLRVAVVTGFAVNFGFYGQFFLVTLYVQQVRGLSSLMTGLLLAVQAGGAVAGAPFGGWATNRFGPRTTTLVGLVLGTAGFLALAVSDAGWGLGWLALALFAIGFSIDTAMTAVTALVLRIAPRGQAGVATGLLTTMRQVGSALGIAVLGAVAAVAGGAGGEDGFRVAMAVAGAAYLLSAVAVRIAAPGGR